MNYRDIGALHAGTGKAEPFTRMTLENEYGTYSIEIYHADPSASAVMTDLVRPLLLAAGYTPDTVDDVTDTWTGEGDD